MKPLSPLRIVTATVTAAVALSLAAVAQSTPEQSTPKQSTPKVDAWPPLKETDKQRVLALAGQFRKADPKLREEARGQLVALGAGAAPLLMQQVSDRPENTNAELFAVLDTMVGPPHATLLAAETKKPRVELRRYLAHRLCRFGDPGLVATFESLQQDKDPQIAFYAQLALLAHRRREALAGVMAYCKMNWGEVGPLVAEVLPAARSAECANWVFEAIAKAEVADKMTGLRLLRHLMTKDQVVVLRGYLEASEHTVKREAVNTARALHGEAPIENLSVFQAIEHAKSWLKKL